MYHLTDGIEFMKSLPPGSVDGIFTDPPWGSGPDIVGQDKYLSLAHQMAVEADRVLTHNGYCLVWSGNRHAGDFIKHISPPLEYKWMFFVYYIPPRYVAFFESSIDPVIIFQRPGTKFRKTTRMIRTLYQKASTGKKDTLHPCSRPFKSVKQILGDFFEEGAYIIDPFAGSDTCGMACRELRLKYDTCEIDPMMHQTGIERNKQGVLW